MTSLTESSGVLVRTSAVMMWPTDVVAPSRPSATARMAMSRSVRTPTRRRESVGFDDGDDADVLVFHEACGVDERRLGRHARRVLRHDVLRLHCCLLGSEFAEMGKGASGYASIGAEEQADWRDADGC